MPKGVYDRGIKTHCINGHLWPKENISIGRKNEKCCKRCKQERLREYKRKYPEASRKRDSLYSKIYREKSKKANKNAEKWVSKNPEKSRAHLKVKQALKAGKLKKEPCFCGELKVDGHHPDYSKPLEVIWLCRLHHKQLHSKLKLDQSLKEVII